LNKHTKELINEVNKLYKKGFTRKQISIKLNVSYSRICQLLNKNYISELEFEEKVDKVKKMSKNLVNILKKYDNDINYKNENWIWLYVTLKLLNEDEERS